MAYVQTYVNRQDIICQLNDICMLRYNIQRLWMTVQRCTHSSKYSSIVDNWLSQYYCMTKQPFGSFLRDCSLFEAVPSDSEADLPNTFW